jgi:hypothetical protein
MSIGPMSFLKHAKPADAIADFRQVFRDAGTYRWWIAILAALTTVGVFSIMDQSWKKQRTLPNITYITSWPADRTAAETRAFIAENQRRKEQQQKLDREQAELGQKLWMSVGRASGVDVDKLKQQADADQAKAALETKARTDAVLKQSGIDPASVQDAAPAGSTKVGE